MNKKTLLGISIPALFAIGMISAAYAGTPGYFIVDDASVTLNEDDNLVYYANVNATLPHVDEDREIGALDSGAPVFGIAWLSLVSDSPVTLDFTGATIHPEIVDSRQNPDNWHPHTGQIVLVDDVGLCLAELNSPHAGIAINDDEIAVNMPAKWADVTDDNFIGATAFVLVPNANCPSPIDTDLPGNGKKPHTLAVPLPGLQVIPLGDA